tara:strand:+ start:148 stop:447 length:300 start_codon:yes stop_codon:yes gene_type:complete
MMNEQETNPNFQEINLNEKKRITSIRAEEVDSDNTEINTIKLPNSKNQYEKKYEEDNSVSYSVVSNTPPTVKKEYLEKYDKLYLTYSVSDGKISWEPIP